jgi:hypothetical protein
MGLICPPEIENTYLTSFFFTRDFATSEPPEYEIFSDFLKQQCIFYG